MSNYDVTISRLMKETESGAVKTEIWAKIKDKQTDHTIDERIWWQDDEGIYHDGTPNLPADIRRSVDTAWIEKKRSWQKTD